MNHSVYKIVDEDNDDEILYIGMTSRNVESRFNEHRQAAFRLSNFKKSELVLAAHYGSIRCDVVAEWVDKETAKEIEYQNIQYHRPIGNTYLM